MLTKRDTIAQSHMKTITNTLTQNTDVLEARTKEPRNKQLKDSKGNMNKRTTRIKNVTKPLTHVNEI